MHVYTYTHMYIYIYIYTHKCCGDLRRGRIRAESAQKNVRTLARGIPQPAWYLSIRGRLWNLLCRPALHALDDDNHDDNDNTTTTTTTTSTTTTSTSSTSSTTTTSDYNNDRALRLLSQCRAPRLEQSCMPRCTPAPRRPRAWSNCCKSNRTIN